MSDLPEREVIAREEGRPWREVFSVHPAAGLFPLLPLDELAELADDIKKHGLLTPLVFCRDGAGRLQLVDGRNRLDAMELAGVPNFLPDADQHHADGVGGFYILAPNDDPYEYVVSLNIHRRHLTTAQKQELITKLLKAKPERSNNATAKLAKVSDKTVARIRERLETRSEIPNVTIRADSLGRRQPAVKARPAKPDGPRARSASVVEKAASPSPAAARIHTFNFACDGIDQMANTMVSDLLTLERAEQLIEALTRYVTLKRAAIDHVGPARGLH